MFCKHCGTQIDDTAKFCPTCGKINDANQPAEARTSVPNYFDSPAPNYFDTPAQNYYSAPVEKESGGSILAFAILGLAFGCTLILSFLGIIFSYIAKSKINAYVMKYGETDGQGSAGKGISTAGLIVSWIMTGILTFYVVIIIAALGL